MNQLLMILHLLGLGGGVASAVGNGVVGAMIQAKPENAPTLGPVAKVVTRFGDAGLTLLWITGILMVWINFGGSEGLPATFWVKIALVVVLTLLVGLMHMRRAAAMKGDAAAARQLPNLGRIASVVLVAVVVLAVITFG